jgi:uncharacterized membrane protein YkvI
MSAVASQSNLREWVSGLLLVAVTISLSGVGDRLLTAAGYPMLGAFFWVVCYASALFVVWLVWLRHFEFTGPVDG